MVDPSTATTNGIAPNTPFVTLRNPLAPFLYSLGGRRVHPPNNVSLELENALVANTRKNAGRRFMGGPTVRRLLSAMSLSPHGGSLNTGAASQDSVNAKFAEFPFHALG
jgi:hypothetical protein